MENLIEFFFVLCNLKQKKVSMNCSPIYVKFVLAAFLATLFDQQGCAQGFRLPGLMTSELSGSAGRVFPKRTAATFIDPTLDTNGKLIFGWFLLIY